jgi:hypothetical protein
MGRVVVVVPAGVVFPHAASIIDAMTKTIREITSSDLMRFIYASSFHDLVSG